MSIEQTECEDYCVILTLVNGELDERVRIEEEKLARAQANERLQRQQHHESDGSYQDLTELKKVDFMVSMEIFSINSLRSEMVSLRETCEGKEACAVAQFCSRLAIQSQLDTPTES